MNPMRTSSTGITEYDHHAYPVAETDCGVAVFAPRDISPLFHMAVDKDIRNVYFPNGFYVYHNL